MARLGWQRPRAPEPLPVALHRRRIFVLPTGYGAFVAVLLLAMIVGALNYNNNPALMLGFALAATALYSLIQGQLVLAGLRAAALHAAPVHAGQVLQLRIDLEMGTRRVRRGIELLLGDARAAVSLEAGERREVALAVPAPRRGWWTPPRLRVSTVQPLGLARTWSWVRPDVRLLVYPALEASAAPLPEGEGERPNQRRSLWGDEFHHLREYRTGDPTRKIAWRPSARTGRLLVREHEDVAGRELLLDWHALGALEYEARIRRLARWVVDAERAGSRYRLRLPRETLGPGIGPDHRHACLRALALLPPA
ncbi:DUF58 domain-containing protein [Coralloluteibacterium stylophorae]|uniref:DUF58 domain-containing protein n=1 Tax=Coralloluteibacterium stylophorae TaxID=1776034 RepID=A0A8J7VW77_9GAMM|nr:DUF58 domain-containing protein [Coralloluteibacterium stylophorae]MBS7457640.1 DUF58 domain-containing protein [Coralloluteibacterium stylophorae]